MYQGKIISVNEWIQDACVQGYASLQLELPG